MKKILLGLLLVVIGLLPTLAKPSREQGVMLHLDVDGESVVVELSGQPKQVRLDTGELVIQWLPDDAAKIEMALEKAGKEEAIPVTLGGLRMAPDASQCLTLDLGRCGTLKVIIPGSIHTSSDVIVVWTSEQLRVIRLKLKEMHCQDAFPDVFGLRMQSRHDVVAAFADGPTPILDAVLAPECGACINGRECVVSMKIECCSDGSGRACSACKICSGARISY